MITTYRGYKIKSEGGVHTVLEGVPYPEEDHAFSSMMAAMTYVDSIPYNPTKEAK